MIDRGRPRAARACGDFFASHPAGDVVEMLESGAQKILAGVLVAPGQSRPLLAADLADGETGDVGVFDDPLSNPLRPFKAGVAPEMSLNLAGVRPQVAVDEIAHRCCRDRVDASRLDRLAEGIADQVMNKGQASKQPVEFSKVTFERSITVEFVLRLVMRDVPIPKYLLSPGGETERRKVARPVRARPDKTFGILVQQPGEQPGDLGLDFAIGGIVDPFPRDRVGPDQEAEAGGHAAIGLTRAAGQHFGDDIGLKAAADAQIDVQDDDVGTALAVLKPRAAGMALQIKLFVGPRAILIEATRR
jgi:hypothetical protein